jgi:flagellin
MNSINTNFAAMTALQSLQNTNKDMLQTQNRISTGFRVASAEDNAAYWSIATTMRSDNKALSTVQDALGLGAATVDVGYTAINSAIDVVSEIKAKLVAAREPGIDRGKVQSEIDELQNQLQSIGDSATFSGQNWLSVDSSAAGYNATKSVVASFSRDSAGAINIGTISIDTSATKLYDASATANGILDGTRDATGAIAASGFSVSGLDISSLTDSSADLTTLESYIKGADMAIGEMTDAATNLGSVKRRIDMQSEFVTAMRATIERGVSQLVDADMNEESTRLQALQVQQQLGIQALLPTAKARRRPRTCPGRRSLCRNKLPASQVNDRIRPATMRFQPSIRTKKSILMGSAMTVGGSIIMPIDMTTDATTTSITRNGSAIKKPISKPRRSSEIMKAGIRIRKSRSSRAARSFKRPSANDSKSFRSFSRTFASMKSRKGSAALL